MKKWTKKDIDKSLVPKLASGCGISSLAAAVLAAKGYTSADDVINKLEVSELSSPFLIRDMEIAADIINHISVRTPVRVEMTLPPCAGCSHLIMVVEVLSPYSHIR